MTQIRNGKRIYGAWAGNPQGHEEDVALCIESVHEPGRGGMIHQCYKKRGHGDGGLYCKQHDPKAVAARSKARTDAYNQGWAIKERGHKIQEKRNEVASLAQRLVPIRSFGQEFDALAKAVKELNELEGKA